MVCRVFRKKAGLTSIKAFVAAAILRAVVLRWRVRVVDRYALLSAADAAMRSLMMAASPLRSSCCSMEQRK